jgi:uncharacterized protein
VPDLSVAAWLALGIAAAFAGFSKTAIGGAGVVAAALAAMVLPARASTGTILPLLICGDFIGVAVYRRSANWQLIVRLLPWVLGGIGVGVAFLDLVRGNRAMRSSIGMMILLVLAAHLVVGGRLKERLTFRPDAGRATAVQHLAAGLAGMGVGFCTMVANSAGAIMAVYLLLSGVTMMEFLGTGAWFFLIVNLIKLPFSLRLGLVDTGSLRLDLALVPGLLAGCGIGVAVIRWIQPKYFERAALGMAAVSAAVLLT